MAESYHDLLRRPEWQKKRLRIMERDNFACRECGDKTTTLNVHHGYYTKGAKPWEYPDESLRCLCEPCHSNWHAATDCLKPLIAILSAPMLEVLHGVLLGMTLCVRCDGGERNPSVPLPPPGTRQRATQLTGIAFVYAGGETAGFPADATQLDYATVCRVAHAVRRSRQSLAHDSRPVGA